MSLSAVLIHKPKEVPNDVATELCILLSQSNTDETVNNKSEVDKNYAITKDHRETGTSF